MEQVSFKHGSYGFALRNASPEVLDVLNRMVELKGSPPDSIDVRVWDHLEVGDIPGVPGWHYDIWNDPIKGANDVHALFFRGADCCTETQDGFFTEGEIHFYTGSTLHRISPARKAGERLLIRASWLASPLMPKNQIYPPHITRRTS